MEEQNKRMFKHGVLDDLVTEAGREYMKMLGRLNEDIARVLKNAHGVAKSEFYLGGEGDDDLIKAQKPSTPKAKGTKTAKKPAPAGKTAKTPKDKDGDIDEPGSRGGKWWRDKHGHVRYGKKPSNNENDRHWKPVPEGEVQSLYTAMEAVLEYGDNTFQSALDKEFDSLGLNSTAMMNIIRDARQYGFSTHDWFLQTTMAPNVDPDGNETPGMPQEEAEETFSQMLGMYREVLTDPKMKKRAKQAFVRRELRERETSGRIERTSKYAKGSAPELMTGNPASCSLKMLALMSDLQILHLPDNLNEVTDEEKAGGSRSALGRIRIDGAKMETLFDRVDDLSHEQIMAMAIGERLYSMQVADTTEDVDALAMQKEDGSFSEGLVGDDNFLAQIRESMDRYTGHEVTDAEHDKQAARINELGHHLKTFVDAFNKDQGGQEVGLILGEGFNKSKLFSDKNAAETMAKEVQARQKVLKEAREAQDDVNVPTPVAMKAGFEKLTKELQAQGVLPKGQSADLLDYQRQAIGWMDKIKRGILAYDTGLGKTPITIGLMAKLMAEGKSKRGILVMPLGLVKQWPEQVKNFFPDAKVVTIGEGQSYEERLEMLDAIKSGQLKADFVIMSASTVSLHPDSRAALKNTTHEEDENGNFKKKENVSREEGIQALRETAAGDRMAVTLRELEGCVFFDEAHHESQGLKNPENVHNAVAREFLKDREHSFLLSATPMPNGKPEDLFELMDLIHPGSAGPDVKRFSNKVAQFEKQVQEDGTVKDVLVGNADWAQASHDIAPYTFFKKKDEKEVVDANEKAKMELPPLVSNTHTLQLPPEIEKLMKNAGNIKPHNYDEKHAKDKKEWVPLDQRPQMSKALAVLQQMQMLSVTPKLLLGDSYKGPQPKIEHTADLILKHFAASGNEDKPFIVLSQFPSSFKYMKEELMKRGVDESLIGEIHGEVKPEDRDVMQEAVNAGKVKVLLLGIKAGGAGLNLQKKVDTGVFLDQPWSPAHKSQALGRWHRTGRKKTDTAYAVNLKINNTIDEDKLANLAGKLSTAEVVGRMESSGGNGTTAIMGAIVQQLGGEHALTKMEPEEIDKQLNAMGLKGLVTPDVLKTKFDFGKLKNTVDFKKYLRFGQNKIDTKRQMNEVRLKRKTITHAEFQEKEGALRREEVELRRWSKSAGEQPAATPKEMEPTEPETSFAPLDGVNPSKNLSESAQAVFAAMKKNKGSLTVTDYLHDHLLPEMEKQEKDPDDRKQMIGQFHANYDQLKKTTEAAVKELRKEGMIGSPSASRPSKDVMPPKPTPFTGKKSKEELAFDASQKKGTSKNPNFEGGWTINVKGTNLPKAFKGHDEIIYQTVKQHRPKTKKDLLYLFFGDEKPDMAVYKDAVTKLHKWGVFE